MNDGDTFDSINELLLAFQERRISDTELAKLRVVLRNNSNARRHFAAIQTLEAAIHFESIAGGATRLGAVASSSVPYRQRRWVPLALAASVALLAGAALIIYSILQQPSVALIESSNELLGTVSETRDEGVAVFIDALNVEWSGDRKPAVGSALPPGKYELRNGVAQLEFHSSARMSLEGPATLNIDSAFGVSLLEGTLRAYVPQHARGFSVSTSHVKVVDYGTDFTVTVSAGIARVQVVEGEVELQKTADGGRNESSQRLKAGSALSVDARGNMSTVPAVAPTLDSFANVQRKIAKNSELQFTAWQARRRETLSNPQLLAYYDFQKQLGNETTLRSHLEAASGADGAIVGAVWSGGRWAGKDALEFKRPSDRVRINVPGSFDSLTLLAWVRVDALDNRLQGLLLTDSYEIGRPHWQITSSGSLRLGIRIPDRNGKLEASGYGSPPVFQLNRLGVWTLLATTYDRSAQRVRHFVDGRCVSEHPIVFDQPLMIGSAEIGNWGVPFDSKQQPIRNFNGRIDELMILKSIATDEQLLEQYQSGHP